MFIYVNHPPDISINLVFKHIHAANSYTIHRQFVPFIYCPLGERVLPIYTDPGMSLRNYKITEFFIELAE